MASTAAMRVGETCEATQLPTEEARAWLKMVAVKTPAITTQGRWKRVASEKARSWVLSPISLMATSRNALRMASTSLPYWRCALAYVPEVTGCRGHEAIPD